MCSNQYTKGGRYPSPRTSATQKWKILSRAQNTTLCNYFIVGGNQLILNCFFFILNLVRRLPPFSTALYIKAVKVKGFKPEVTKMAGFIGTTPEGAAMKIVHAVKKDKALVLTDFAKIAYAIRRLSPALAR